MKKIKIGLYGSNGHQVQHLLEEIDRAELVAVCGINSDSLPGNPQRYESYDEFLRHPGMELVSLCSPNRRGQYQDIKDALRAGMHVYAEKPAVLEEAQLDELLRLAASRNLRFREMCTTSYDPPYAHMKQLVASGVIGDIVQVFVQKSYPFGDWRPQDEDIDGGLLRQAGIHAVRMIEQVALRRIVSVSSIETQLGNPQAASGGGLHMAAGLLLQLEGGAIGSVVINYLNPSGMGVWGNEQLRIFGTDGFIETIDGSGQIRIVTQDKKEYVSESPPKLPSHLEMYVQEILGQPAPLLQAEQEFQPLRAILRAKLSPMRQERK